MKKARDQMIRLGVRIPGFGQTRPPKVIDGRDSWSRSKWSAACNFCQLFEVVVSME